MVTKNIGRKYCFEPSSQVLRREKDEDYHACLGNRTSHLRKDYFTSSNFTLPSPFTLCFLQLYHECLPSSSGELTTDRMGMEVSEGETRETGLIIDLNSLSSIT